MTNISIIGGGLSGTLLAVNLLQSSPGNPIDIKLIDNRSEEDLGPAFSTNEDYLLNVPAGMMGAVWDDHEHFLKWLNSKGISAQKTDFLPRKLYRTYIKELFSEALIKKKSNILFERIQGEVTDITTDGSKAAIFLADGKSISADKLALALGNFPPRNPPIASRGFINSKLYIRNPWIMDSYSAISKDASVFFIGTGQTTVDIAAGLHRNGHTGKIFAISRHGFLPLVHKVVDIYPQFYTELKDIKSILNLYKIIRSHIEKAEKAGYDRRAVIDSMRPFTQELWMNLPADEKGKFIRHLFRYWEIIRSRIPQESDSIIKQMQSTGQFNILTGKITDLIVRENSIDVCYKPRNTVSQKYQPADIVINCIGPELDYSKIQNTLIKNLIKRGLIQPDPINLGINALPDGTIIHNDGTASDVFFTIGLPMRGILWETLAAPEIRVQAANLSRLMLKNTN